MAKAAGALAFEEAHFYKQLLESLGIISGERKEKMLFMKTLCVYDEKERSAS